MNFSNDEVDNWNSLAASYWNSRPSRQKWVHEYVLFPKYTELLSQLANSKILDYGCGDGFLYKKLFDRFPHLDIYAYDESKEMYTIASDVIAEDKLLFSLDNKQFDIIILNMVIQDVENVVQCISKLRTSLHKKGTLIIALPHPVFSLIEKDHLTTKRERIKPSKEKGIYRYSLEESERVFWEVTTGCHTKLFNRTMETYSNLFCEAGFHIVSIKEPQPIDEGICEPDLYNIHRQIPRTMMFLLQAI